MPEERPRVRLQIALCPKVAEELERHANEMQRSQAWLAGWAIGISLDEKKVFAKELSNRLVKAKECQEWSDEDQGPRLQLRIHADYADQLQEMGNALNQSPMKLAGLAIQSGLKNNKSVLRIMKSALGRAFVGLVNGKEKDPDRYEVDDDSPDSNKKPKSK